MLQKASFFNLVLCLTGVILCFSSCDQGRVYDTYRPIDAASWAIEDTLQFPVTIEDPLASYNLYANVRTTSGYEYSNLFLFIDITDPNQKTQKDTIECVLAGIDGRWYGASSGSIINNRILFKRGVRFPSKGTYLFTLQQGMREATLDNITDVGLRVERAQ